ncbi:uncharacterized protein LOC133187880 [Saccostrea echinata]|uniref:uncharacterized protein LOC133187880 n=1 Tax=Saccostrea echinata TaxID=191078 RepID=UPI002A82F585|nr:uncharacterized protein LOC133187880 [Saccostrea echinata]
MIHMFLTFLVTVWIMLYTHVCGTEINNCIQSVADIYSILAYGSTCFNSSIDDYKQDVKNCSSCDWTDSTKKDNYFSFRIKYGSDTVVKLDNKKKESCNYKKENVIIECNMDQKTIEPLKSCIIDQCLSHQKDGETKDDGTENVAITKQEDTINHSPAMIVAVVEGFLLGIISVLLAASIRSRKTELTVCRQIAYIGRCCSNSSLTSGSHSDQRQNVPPTSSETTTKSVYEDIPDKNIYNHLHEKPKSSAPPGRYSTMKDFHNAIQTEKNFKPGANKDDKNQENTFLIALQSSENVDGKTNLHEMQSTGAYFILEKKCPEEKNIPNRN